MLRQCMESTGRCMKSTASIWRRWMREWAVGMAFCLCHCLPYCTSLISCFIVLSFVRCLASFIEENYGRFFVGAVYWMEIPAIDLDRAKTFYGSLFSWGFGRPSEMGMEDDGSYMIFHK